MPTSATPTSAGVAAVTLDDAAGQGNAPALPPARSGHARPFAVFSVARGEVEEGAARSGNGGQLLRGIEQVCAPGGVEEVQMIEIDVQCHRCADRVRGTRADARDQRET